jgi:uncharacterized protein (DUF952 family)/uncharacterized protein YciI
MRPTYHLVPADAWTAHDRAVAYAPPSLAAEGFIHCTDGAEAMVATANRHYRDDPRSFLVLTVDLDAIAAPWRFDDSDRIYPHVYGPIAPAAVLAAVPVPRAADGTFLAFGTSDVPDGVAVRRIFVVEATYGPDAERLRPAARPEHLARIAQLMTEGRVIEAGGYLDLSTALMLVEADSAEDAVALFEDDVYLRTGVWTAVSAKPFGRVIPTADEPPPAA